MRENEPDDWITQRRKYFDEIAYQIAYAKFMRYKKAVREKKIRFWLPIIITIVVGILSIIVSILFYFLK